MSPETMRTPEIVKDAWGEVEQLAIDAGVEGPAWMAAVARFWRVANLAGVRRDAAHRVEGDGLTGGGGT